MLVTLFLGVLGQTVLSGSQTSVEEAQEKARIVLVASHERTIFLAGIGASTCGMIGLKPVQVLKGSVEGEEMDRVSISAGGPEVMPAKGKEFIYFLDVFGGHLNVVKVIPRTDENLEAVRRQIVASKPSRAATVTR